MAQTQYNHALSKIASNEKTGALRGRAPVRGGSIVLARDFARRLNSLRRAAMCSSAYAAPVRLCAVAHTPNVFRFECAPIDA